MSQHRATRATRAGRLSSRVGAKTAAALTAVLVTGAALTAGCAATHPAAHHPSSHPSGGTAGGVSAATGLTPVAVTVPAPLPTGAPDAAVTRTLTAQRWVNSDARAWLGKLGGFTAAKALTAHEALETSGGPAEQASTARAVSYMMALPQSQMPANRLYIPSLSVYAPIDLAHAAGGELQLPADASRVARYDASPSLAAAAGTTIVAGHVTNTPQIGVLYPLATIRKGALVYTSDPRGRLRTWRVTSVSAPLKADLPSSLFTATGRRRLAIITCGGTVTWNPNGTRSYPRNVVVLASPVMAR